MSFKKEKRLETIIYLVLWGMLFIAPVMSLYIRTTNDSDIEFNWSEVLMVWRQYAVFFVIFLLHNHLLAPLLVYRQKKVLYFSIVGTLVAGFVVYQCTSRPDDLMRRPDRGPRHEMAEKWRGDREKFEDHRPPGGEKPDWEHRPDGEHKPHGKQGFEGDVPPPFREGPGEGFEKHGPRGFKPDMAFMGQREIVALVILILMLGANLGIKLYFRQRRDQKKLADLQQKNLEQQLEYLKYQINPHFLMNTLNNIHALVDIDPELAKSTIVELSKMLRFMLYEGNKPTVPLSRELDFLDHYITLMRLRYTDRVTITVKKPDEVPNCKIPPLIFITFVENAFKHGVSYQQDSFIDIALTTHHSSLTTHHPALIFTCRNSKIPDEDDKHGGVGLANVKQRLELIYGKNFTLDINDGAQEYNIRLEIPL